MKEWYKMTLREAFAFLKLSEIKDESEQMKRETEIAKEYCMAHGFQLDPVTIRELKVRDLWEAAMFWEIDWKKSVGKSLSDMTCITTAEDLDAHRY